ncbi:MAG: hypothetical protein ACLQMF_04260 [Rectinemataceae bacterium]
MEGRPDYMKEQLAAAIGDFAGSLEIDRDIIAFGPIFAKVLTTFEDREMGSMQCD